MPTTFEIIIYENGCLLVEAGDENQNKLTLGLLEGIVDDPVALQNFLSIDAGIIDGDSTYCG